MGHTELYDNYLINWIARQRAQKLSSRITESIRDSLAGISTSEELYGMVFVIEKKRDRNLIAQAVEKVIEDREERFDNKALLAEPQTANWHARDLALHGLQRALGSKSS